MNLEEIKKLNIYEKMSLITNEIGVIEKNLNIEVTKTRSYKAVSERDVIDGIKPLEEKYRVYSYPISRQIVDKDILTKENDYGTTNSLFMRIETVYRFVNIDKPDEFIETTVYGDGIDTGDKAPGKAMTYADKYALMKAYKLSTGDDPDNEASPKEGYKKENLKATPKQIEYLLKMYRGDNLTKLLETNKIKVIEDITFKKADELITTNLKKMKEKQKEIYEETADIGDYAEVQDAGDR